jgi:soluble lytic murein transglycosylase-like protein
MTRTMHTQPANSKQPSGAPRLARMRRMPAALLLALGLGVAGAFVPPAQAQIYKYTDAEGIVHYSSTPPKNGEQAKAFRFPCYASDPSCSGRLDWEQVPLDTRAFGAEIRAAASQWAVDESLIRAIIHAESAYQPDALSPKGAQGLMQLMPATQQELEVPDALDPAMNIDGGTRYLAQMLELFDGDVALASAAYNAGPEAVRRHQGIPPFNETREYVRRITILHRRYRLSGG